MTLTEIQQAVEAGRTVYWKTPAYVVMKDSIGRWLVHCVINDSYHGLTHRDGVTVHGKPEDFHILPQPPAGYTAEELERDNPYNQWMHDR